MCNRRHLLYYESALMTMKSVCGETEEYNIRI